MTKREIEAMRKEIEAANAHRGAGLKKLYLCDPRKNRECKKTACAYRDGTERWCFATTKKSIGRADCGILWDITFDFWKNRGQNEVLYVIY